MEEQDSKEVDPELNIFSPNFKPEKYLTSSIPTTKGSLFDNLNHFNQALQAADNRISEKILTPVHRKRGTTKNASQPDEPSTSSRRFLPHQQLVTRERSAKYTRNILSTFENPPDSTVQNCLKPLMDTQTRVKIYIRKEKGVRGVLTGIIEAFDKHWNIVLVDAVETWKRRKFAFSENKTPGMQAITADVAHKRLAAMGIKVPQVKVKSIDRKYVQCTRRVPQIMVRGEQIVLVTRDNSLF